MTDQDLKAAVTAVLDKLTPLASKVARMFYGIGMDKQSIEEISKQFARPVSEVESIIEEALRIARGAAFGAGESADE
jgi:DNA-directed RNA polymerase sigma subunit (sigma70/sigma32)